MEETKIAQQIVTHYGFHAEFICETQGGTVGYTYSIDKKYFLKIYDTNLVITERCTEKLYEQLLILDILQQRSNLRDKICYPIKTANGEYFFKDQNWIGVLFNLIDGEALGYGAKYTAEDIRQLSALVKDLHAVDTSEISAYCPAENFDLSFCDKLLYFLERETQTLPPKFAEMALQNASMITQKIDEAKSGAKTVNALRLPFVLCHTDIHGGNIMRDKFGKLFLVDWENLILAPKEADLFLFSDDYSLSLFADNINRTALFYYILRRDLEDIWEFLNSTAHGEYCGEELDEVYGILERILTHLSRVSEQ